MWSIGRDYLKAIRENVPLETGQWYRTVMPPGATSMSIDKDGVVTYGYPSEQLPAPDNPAE